MVKHLICLLAKNGDLINFAPIAKHLFDSSGERPLWIVHKLFEPTLRGFSYIESKSVAFDFRRVDLALKVAGSIKHGRLLVGTTFGKFYGGDKSVSHNCTAWKANGFESNFYDTNNFGLVFDRRDATREAALVKRHCQTDKPLLLLNVGCAQSSPFPSREVFSAAIQKRWSKHFKILNLCDVRSPRIYDMLALLERAAILITADTAIQHLAAAVPGLPVVYLHGDKFFLAAEPRYKPAFRCSYSEALKKMEHVNAAIAGSL